MSLSHETPASLTYTTANLSSTASLRGDLSDLLRLTYSAPLPHYARKSLTGNDSPCHLIHIPETPQVLVHGLPPLRLSASRCSYTVTAHRRLHVALQLLPNVRFVVYSL